MKYFIISANAALMFFYFRAGIGETPNVTIKNVTHENVNVRSGKCGPGAKWLGTLPQGEKTRLNAGSYNFTFVQSLKYVRGNITSDCDLSYEKCGATALKPCLQTR